MIKMGFWHDLLIGKDNEVISKKDLEKARKDLIELNLRRELEGLIEEGKKKTQEIKDLTAKAKEAAKKAAKKGEKEKKKDDDKGDEE